jgi:hypothetical protein
MTKRCGEVHGGEDAVGSTMSRSCMCRPDRARKKLSPMLLGHGGIVRMETVEPRMGAGRKVRVQRLKRSMPC